MHAYSTVTKAHGWYLFLKNKTIFIETFFQINSWCRKAGSCGFHFLPVPGDPFALPFNANSDPLRGPIFVPLDITCLMLHSDTDLFEDFTPETREKRLLLFQEAILKRLL